ncbi:hypothetical protein PILCRDRAFT_485645 [Piloderma croceum F 1598]|uniref:Uncharacterized protein n=1 Tax=Piloderma croceum (strain F 1598) TaxID=765440 RepID=A0A0C3FC03_PILCF|nr:hypothetical protein PILCRDRAFT_485645 [Piloderma croceum F 1598]
MGALEDLLVQEKALVSRIQAMEDTLSGVHVHVAELRSVNRGAGTYNLPSEILSAIFEAGLTEMLKTGERDLVPWFDQSKERTTRFELLVSSVSRRWRNIALQTPRLWVVLVIDVQGLTHDLYDLYLRRSKMCPLDITLDCSHRDSRKSDCVKRHLDQLIPHVGRWRKFIVRNGSLGSRLSALALLCAPALETLVLDITTNYPEIELFSGGASRLSSLELIGAKFRPPLGAVKYLKLSRSFLDPLLSYDQLSRLINPIRSLTRLSIAADMVHDAANRPPIELPSVLVLDIYFHYRDTDSSTLHILDFPAVKSLTIHGGTDVAIGALTQNHRVYPHVQSLTLANDSEYSDRENAPDALALDFISLVPAVRDVVFQGTNPTAILNVLHSRKSTDEVLWPDLSAITVVAAGRAKVMEKKQTWTCIVQVVENRIQLGHPISSIKLSSQIVERGGQRQRQRLREQAGLTEC